MRVIVREELAAIMEEEEFAKEMAAMLESYFPGGKSARGRPALAKAISTESNDDFMAACADAKAQAVALMDKKTVRLFVCVRRAR